MGNQRLRRGFGILQIGAGALVAALGMLSIATPWELRAFLLDLLIAATIAFCMYIVWEGERAAWEKERAAARPRDVWQ